FWRDCDRENRTKDNENHYIMADSSQPAASSVSASRLSLLPGMRSDEQLASWLGAVCSMALVCRCCVFAISRKRKTEAKRCAGGRAADTPA
ncbi:MAG: hypothetical protein Q4B94_02555, partial [Pseudomonadota bacterium]|nr:hypothetical protein [Pseudomonadota bacterium]